MVFIADDPADDEKMIRWARECWTQLNPFADRAVYVNALDEGVSDDAPEEDERPMREVYGVNYERLRDLKTKFDPTNLFRQNSNITPR
jgi:FAD/FMN-containing dehydrogenase